MNKLVAGLSVAGATALVSLAGPTPAQAYPDTNPSGIEVNSSTVVTGSGPSSATLPNTGGPDEVLLLGGAALLVAGGAVVVVVRRRSA